MAGSCVFQRFSEPIGVIAAISENPSDLWEAVQQCACADVITELSGGDKLVQRTTVAIADGV